VTLPVLLDILRCKQTTEITTVTLHVLLTNNTCNVTGYFSSLFTSNVTMVISVVYLHLGIPNNTCNVTMVISVVYLHLGIANNICNVTMVISVVYLH
jgi:hypothetical protein